MKHQLLFAFGACLLSVSAFAAPKAVIVTPTIGTDIAAAVNEAKAGVDTVGTVTINLAEGASYTLCGSIVNGAGIVINGNGAKIDASALNAPFILMSEKATVDTIGGTQNYLGVDAIAINNVTVENLNNSIFYDNNTKYCVIDFTIDNVVFALTTTAVENESLISFKAGGAKDFTIKNSTVYGNGEVAKYFIRYNNSARLDRYGYDTSSDFQSMIYLNNTFYNLLISSGQWGNYSAISGQKYIKFDVQKNIWVNCGKDIIRRMAGGRLNGSNPMEFALNTYFEDGENQMSSESGYDKSGSILVTNPDFANPEAGNFTLGASTQQAQYQTGAPKWLVTFVAPDVTAVKAALLEEINKAKALANTSGSEDALNALRVAIADAEAVYNTGAWPFEFEAAISALKAAEDAFQQSGIGSIEADNAAEVEYFNLQGVRVEDPTNGLYIRRQGNKVSKVIVK